MTTRKPRFAAVIGHSDSLDLLDGCIAHHLAIGCGFVFVSINDAGVGLPERWLRDARVRAGNPLEFARADPFLFLTHAVREVEQWAAPDWVLFADSDEFWLPQSGDLASTCRLAETDIFAVERFNVAVQRWSDGSYRAPDLAELDQEMLVAGREMLDDAYLAGDTQTPWIMALDAPKLLVRACAIKQVSTGGHSITAHDPQLRWQIPDDLFIAHLPFTGEERFRHKITAVRKTLAEQAGRFDSRQAWHWRHWAALPDAEIAGEFRRQTFRASAVPILQRQNVLVTAAQLYPRLRGRGETFKGDALHEMLGRMILNYERPNGPADATEAGPGSPAPSSIFSPGRHVERMEDCYFYHSMDVPGNGEVVGQWDLRGQEPAYLGNVDLAGRSVLEIGPASGYLTFWMERQGAHMTSFDLDEHQEWDIVPFAGVDRKATIAQRAAAVRQINNSWWYLHERFSSRARMVYGAVYQLDKIEETFDIVTLNSVMLHLRDPVQAIAQAAARSHNQLIITDVAEAKFLPPGASASPHPIMHFLPQKANNGPMDTWWIVSAALTIEVLKIAGFPNITMTHHTQRLLPAEDMLFYTIVATR